MGTSRRRCAAAALVAASLAGVALGLSGCASSSTRVPTGIKEPDKYLIEKGNESIKAKKWLRAREYFQQLIDSYPQSTYRPDARLGLGDAYLGEGSAEAIVLAINEFKEFLALFPSHPRADYAQYRLGMCHFEQMANPERDQTETREAVAEFEHFLERFPGSALEPDVRAKLREARDRRSESEYRVGLFYFRVRWYPGAIDRFNVLLKDDPAFTNRDAVYYYLAESLIKIQRPAEALPYFDRLVSEFDKSEFLLRAKKRIDELKSPAPPDPKRQSGL